MDHLPAKVLSVIFRYLKQTDLIEASAVCKQWYTVINNNSFSSKIKETNQLFDDKDWLLKTYRKHFDRFKDSVYWDSLHVLRDEKLPIVEKEILDRMFYSIPPFPIWSHFWSCSRS